VKLLKGKRLTPVMRVENQSFSVGSGGGSDRKAGLYLISALMDALFHLQVNISFFCWTKLREKVAALAVL
jgi:hypothetical protein